VSVLTSIEALYPLKFYYKSDWFTSESITVNLNNASIDETIRLILSDKPYTYRIIENEQIIILPLNAVAELTNTLTDFSGPAASIYTYTIIGDPGEIGNYRTVDVTGMITDGVSGEPLIGAYVQLENLLQGTITDTEGNYKLSLSPGLYTLMISSLGYETSVRQVRIVGNGVLDVELFEKSIEIDDIIIYAQRRDRNVTSNQMSLVELDVRTIRQLPLISGGKDVIKGLTSMPGISTVGEFSSGVNVRGGGEDQNQYLINEAPLFNTTHLFGLLSAVNPDIVEKLTLYKGHLPASYGERISSVFDIRTMETFPKEPKIKGGIGLFDSKLIMDLPIIKDKIFMNLGGRSAYSNWLLKRTDEVDLHNSSAFFYDLNAAMNIRTKNSRILISAYSSFDDFTFNDEVRYAYKTNAGSLLWNHLISTDYYSYLSLSFSDYKVEKDNINDAFAKARTESGITYAGIKYRLNYSGIGSNILEGGINLFGYSIQPGRQKPLDEKSLVSESSIEKERGIEGAVFLNDELSLSRNLTINAGIRLSGYAYLGPKTMLRYEPDMPLDSTAISGMISYGRSNIIQSYFYAEPRISSRIQINSKSSIKISFNRNVQYLNLISSSAVSTPSDIWKLSDIYTKPLVANQYTIGYYRNFMDNVIESYVELYYKQVFNVLEYKKGSELEMISDIEQFLINANGRNYGFEFLIKKNSGRTSGWIAYTFSRSVRKTTGIFRDETLNKGEYFPASYDKPHTVNLVANYNYNKRIVFSANFTYSTGRPITLPEYKYNQNNATLVYFSEKNKYRMPDYHRLDLSFRINESLRIKKRWKGSWSFSILNVYGRKNAYTIFYKKDNPKMENDYNIYSLNKLYIVGKPVITITYNFIF